MLNGLRRDLGLISLHHLHVIRIRRKLPVQKPGEQAVEVPADWRGTIEYALALGPIDAVDHVEQGIDRAMQAFTGHLGEEQRCLDFFEWDVVRKRVPKNWPT